MFSILNASTHIQNCKIVQFVWFFNNSFGIDNILLKDVSNTSRSVKALKIALSSFVFLSNVKSK